MATQLESDPQDTRRVKTQRVLICDALDPVAVEIFDQRGVETEIRTGLSEDELVLAAPEFDGLVVRSATRVTRRILEAAPRVRVVGRAGIGVDNVDCVAATERGVVVMNTPTGNATTTAELAISLLCSLARHVPRADRVARSGSWKKKGLTGTEITGKRLGIVGLGRIGRLVAARGQGLKMQVSAYDPYVQQQGIESPVAGVELLDLDELLATSDFISIHVPLMDSTRNLLSWERISKIKPGARLINVARGGIVDEEAVVDALVEGRLAGAAFDVLATEPPPADHPFLGRDDVILTPHLGASSHEAQVRVAHDIAVGLSDFLLDGISANAVNAPAIPAEAMREMAPFLQLAEKIGAFLAQRLREPIRKLELTVAGDVAQHDVEPIRLAVLVGVLRQSLETGVNFVNADALARERGLRILTSSGEETEYVRGHIKVRASTRAAGDSHVVSGAVFGREPRIVRVDGVRLDLPPTGTLLLTRHHDRPGVFGQLGSLLGEQGINIRRVELGPVRGEDGTATGFLTLYGVPDPDVIAAIAAMPAVEEVQLIQL